MADEDTSPAAEPTSAGTKLERRPQPDFFERMFNEWPWPRSRLVPAVWPAFEGSEMIRVEESTDDKEVVVRAEVPGIDPDKDVEITVSDHTLRLRVERREESTSDEKGVKRSEFRYGSFSRAVPLPAGASEKDVNATYKDGILEVRIPIDKKAAEAKKVKIRRR